LRPVCSLPAEQLTLHGGLPMPRLDAKVSLSAWGLLPGAPTLTGMGLTPTEKAQRAMSSALGEPMAHRVTTHHGPGS